MVIKVNKYILSIEKVPVVTLKTIMKEVMEKMTEFKIGCVVVLDSKKKLVGILTDGDIRRIILNSQKPLSAILIDDIEEYLNKKPVTIKSDDEAKKAAQILENLGHYLPILNNKKEFLGLFRGILLD